MYHFLTVFQGSQLYFICTTLKVVILFIRNTSFKSEGLDLFSLSIFSAGEILINIYQHLWVERYKEKGAWLLSVVPTAETKTMGTNQNTRCFD